MSITPRKFAFFTNSHSMNYPSLDKAKAELSSLKQIQPFGGNRGFSQSISFNKAKVVKAAPLFTLIETA